MDLDQETAKELVKSVIDGFEEESIVNAESVTLFLCKECLPYLTKMNIPANIVQAVNGPVSYTHLTLPTTPYV